MVDSSTILLVDDEASVRKVLTFPLDNAPEFGLSNRIAVGRAKRLLEENYFQE